MDDFLRINLIHLFTFYLSAIFVIGTLRRLSQYREIALLVKGMRGRWPQLWQQIKKHGGLLISWSTFRSASVALVLMTVQLVCSRLIWPEANISFRDLFLEWWMVAIVALAGIAMLGVDLYFVVRVGRIDRMETERYLDQAEHWLTSWKAPFVKVFTFGIVNPRKIVDEEVRKAMEGGKGMLNRNLWWMSLQAFLRVLFGLCLWICWAVHPNVPG